MLQEPDLKIFVLSKNNDFSHNIKWFLAEEPSLSFEIFQDSKTFLAHIHLNPHCCILLVEDEEMPILWGEISELQPTTDIICVSLEPNLQTGISLIKKGVSEYIALEEWDNELIKIWATKKRQQEYWREEQKVNLIEKFKALGFIGSSRIMRKLYRQIENIAITNSNVLIRGETGTGKELCAKAIHHLSKRKEAPIYYLDISSALPNELEKKLFGLEKNTFAGILQREIGALEQASNGVLILDNIDALPLHLQGRLQRAIQEKKFLRPGGNNIVFFQARLIYLSQKDLQQAIKKSLFRPDIYRQISTNEIIIPELKKRGQDILQLAQHFLREFIRKNKIKNLIFTHSAKDTLLQYSFPGNIRELKNIIEASALMTESQEIGKEQLIFTVSSSIKTWLEEELSLEEYNEKIIFHFLEKYDNNVLEVAQKLKIGKSTIYRLLKLKSIENKNTI